MKSFFRSFFASLLAIVVVVLFVFGMIASKSAEKPRIERGSWLVVDLYGSISEYDPPSNVMGELLGGRGETLQRVLTNFDKVCVDDRIEGVIIKMSSSNGAGRAMLEEMRGAVKKVRASGKKVYGFSDSMDRDTYVLAAACDSFFMPPTAYFTCMGMAAHTEHIKNTLEKLRIRPNLHRIKDYKSAAEMIVREDMSEASRENRNWMLEEYWDLYCSALEEDRGISEERVVAAMEKALFMIEEAVEAGFVDSMMYWDEFRGYLTGGDDDLKTVSQGDYEKIEPASLGLKGKKKIAVVHAQGTIGGRKNRVDPMLGIMMGHESVSAALRAAREDDDVAAVVFRIDSGGGEGLASDLISREVRVTAGEKPVVVSMVDVAGSGGYMIAYRATKIVADAATLTGSIGSISAKFNMDGFQRMLGITHDTAEKGPHANMFSPYRDFTEEEWKIFTENHWAGFNMWLGDVAEYRGMTFEEAEKLAHGRVFTGRQGAANGLVDEVGGLDRAVELARELAGVPADEKVAIEHFPERKSFFEELVSEGAFTTAARYVVWRFIRDDVSETWALLNSPRMHMAEEIEIR
ncbi:MAG: signal peptide peptidase SppA [Candidatus Krumholzibacteria bacterium]|nr:signal peptide peptidase SppA [Candidatus Krumholzibacteria bacterium]